MPEEVDFGSGVSRCVFVPFNIDAKINSAYVAIGLLYGKKDFYQTIDISGTLWARF